MSKVSGLTLDTQRKRIVKRTPRPQVTVVQAAPVEEQPESELVVEPPKTENHLRPEMQREKEGEPEEVKAEVSKKTRKKESKKPEKKHWKEGTSGGHRLRRYEGRLHGDHEEIMDYLHDKGAKQTHRLNREIKKPEMLFGFIELIKPFHKKVSFLNTNFERGQMYGPGAERLREEVGTSFKRAAYKYVLTQIGKGKDNLLQAVVDELTDKEKEELMTAIALSGEKEAAVEFQEKELLVVNE